MNNAAEDVKDMLEDDSTLGLTFKVDLFIGKEPATPDNCVTIYDTPSFPPQMTIEGEGSSYYRSSVQIRVRNNSYDDGMALAINIMQSLHERAQETWNGTLYTVVQALGEPALLAWDGNDRALIVNNYNLQRR
jgi:hypothetical protein